MKRTSLLALFLEEHEQFSPISFSLFGGGNLAHLKIHSENDALASDMVAIGEDMWRVIERMELEKKRSSNYQ